MGNVNECVVKMDENQIKRKTQNRLDMFEWMLAIDFDSVEVRRSHNNVFQKHVQVLDKSDFTVKKGD